MADAFHLAGFEVCSMPGRAGAGPQTVCPLTRPLPILPGVGCDHARPLLWGNQAGHIPRRGLRGWLQLRRCPGLCQRSVCRLLPTSYPHTPERCLSTLDWALASHLHKAEGECSHSRPRASRRPAGNLNEAGGWVGLSHLGWRAQVLSNGAAATHLQQIVLLEGWLSMAKSVF